MSSSNVIDVLPPFRDDKTLNVIVETPAGSRSKLKYEPKKGLFAIGKFLPEGFVFPFDFGFIPGTRAEDGDPLDVMLIAEAGTAPGCLVPARLLGVLEARETSKKEAVRKTVRNDRILAVPVVSRQYADLKDIREMPGSLREQVEHFLTSYGALEGKNFHIDNLGGPETAARLVQDNLIDK